MARKANTPTTASTADCSCSSSQAGPEKNVGGSNNAGSADGDAGAAADSPKVPLAKPRRRRRNGMISRMCAICERFFSSRSAVRRHLVTHTGHKAFMCTICGRQFALKGNLMAHVHTHSGAKPYECHLCPQVFSQRCSLNRHLRRTHKKGGK